MPSLSCLKSIACQSLDWLWHWYWKELDHITFPSERPELETEKREQLRRKLSSVVKAYLQDRRAEVREMMQPRNRISSFEKSSPASQVATAACVRECQGNPFRL